MSNQIVRQSSLFAGEDWRILHKAFTEVNFNSFTFDTMRKVMVDYIRSTYPEDFNDWIETSEFVALIDSVALIGGALAYRQDLNAHDNFLFTAEARESIIRHARFLSYIPKRNRPSRGFLKIVSVSTNDEVYDAFGNSLTNTPVQWDDPRNPEWFEQFIIILNNSFSRSTQFGNPIKNINSTGIKTELYQLSSSELTQTVYPYTSYVGTQSLNFEVVSSDIDELLGSIIETSPGISFSNSPDRSSPRGTFSLLYRNDGIGNSSFNTGFFVHFKQGNLTSKDFLITTPIENYTFDLSEQNINEDDVWVQSIRNDGVTLREWKRVQSTFYDQSLLINSTNYGNNLVYNDLPYGLRNIYETVTQPFDNVVLRFSDGRFGEAPNGRFRCWYRRSSGSIYTIRPQDMSGIVLSIPYLNYRNELKQLSITLSLQENVGNSTPTESNEQIRKRAPSVYYTQNRMVSGEDYNAFPLQTNLAIMIKAVNRTYSGHNYYFDLNDPTGTYQGINYFGDDGILYRESNNKQISIPVVNNSIFYSSNITNILDNINNMINDRETISFLINEYLRKKIKLDLMWKQSDSRNFSSSGYFLNSFKTPVSVGLPNQIDDNRRYITEGALIKFKTAGWVSIDNIYGDGDGSLITGRGKVLLDQNVQTYDETEIIIPAISDVLSSTINGIISDKLRRYETFGLSYNINTRNWDVIDNINLDSISPYNINSKNTNRDSSWSILVQYTPGKWDITSRGIRYVFESEKQTRFFYSNAYKVRNSETGLRQWDQLIVMGINRKPENNDSIGTDNHWKIIDNYRYNDGYSEPRKIIVYPLDSDDDGQPDNPQSFIDCSVINFPNEFNVPENYIFWKKVIGQDNYEYFNPIKISVVDFSLPNQPRFLLDEIVFDIYSKKFYKSKLNDSSPKAINLDFDIIEDNSYKYAIGRNNLKYHWKHFASSDHRIDPSQSNIIDIFVLTTQYNIEYRNWINSNDSTINEPIPPSETLLKASMYEFEKYKMFSDQIVWRPVKYKPLFGNNAKEEVRCTFKVIKTDNTTISDGELKAKIIKTINEFFNTGEFDFGETFYMSELYAAIHQKMATSLGSIAAVPINEESSYGNLHEIRCDADELFISVADVSNIEIIPTNTTSQLRIK